VFRELSILFIALLFAVYTVFGGTLNLARSVYLFADGVFCLIVLIIFSLFYHIFTPFSGTE